MKTEEQLLKDRDQAVNCDDWRWVDEIDYKLQRWSLSRLTTEAMKVGDSWCDGSFGEPVGEMNALLHRRNVQQVVQLLYDSHWTAQEFEEAVMSSVSDRWADDHLSYFFLCCLDANLL